MMKNWKKIGFWIAVVWSVFLVARVDPVLAMQGAESGTQPNSIWVSVFEDSFAPRADFPLALGDTAESGLTVSRKLENGAYRWTMSSTEGKYSVVTLPNLTIPSGYSLRAEVDLQMPAFDPYVCSGLVFGERDGSFDVFLVCSDRTYALYRNESGNWADLIPFTTFLSADPGDRVSTIIQVENGWADFILAGEVVDSFRISNPSGQIGLFAQPMSEKATTVDFRNLRVFVAPSLGEAASAAAGADVPDDLARTLRLLELKGRIASTAGTMIQPEARTLELANLGAYVEDFVGEPSFDALIQAKVRFKSAYEKPDYSKAGCGFTIRHVDANNFVQMYLSLDGTVYLLGVRNGNPVPIMSYAFSKWTLEGEAELTLVANGSKLTAMINGRILGTIEDASWFMSGRSGLTVFSGTNFDYGQRCEFSDILIYNFAFVE